MHGVLGPPAAFLSGYLGYLVRDIPNKRTDLANFNKAQEEAHSARFRLTLYQVNNLFYLDVFVLFS